jgi:hypothetical protein
MRQVAWEVFLVLASVDLGVLFLSIAYTLGALGGAPMFGQASRAEPNFVFILADDMRYDELKYMPKTRSLLGAEGMSFNEAFVSDTLCCSSRATILRSSVRHAQTPSLSRLRRLHASQRRISPCAFRGRACPHMQKPLGALGTPHTPLVPSPNGSRDSTAGCDVVGR